LLWETLLTDWPYSLKSLKSPASIQTFCSMHCVHIACSFPKLSASRKISDTVSIPANV
jgi:hypothetical protein